MAYNQNGYAGSDYFVESYAADGYFAQDYYAFDEVTQPPLSYSPKSGSKKKRWRGSPVNKALNEVQELILEPNEALAKEVKQIVADLVSDEKSTLYRQQDLFKSLLGSADKVSIAPQKFIQQVKRFQAFLRDEEDMEAILLLM